MKNSKLFLIKIFLPIIAFSIISVGGVLATYTSTKEMTGKVALNKIDINTKLEMKQGEEYVEYIQPNFICPGAKINQILKITSTGSDCWIRLKPNLVTDIEFSQEELNNLLDFEDASNWTKKIYNNEIYYYYNQKLSPETDLTAYTGINIPNKGNEAKGKNLKIDIIVQAIQSTNFDQNLLEDNPWGEDVEIIEFNPN